MAVAKKSGDDGNEKLLKALEMHNPPKLRVVDADERADSDSQGVWRPSSFDAYVGQKPAQMQTRMWMTAAVMENRQPGHMIIAGPPGLGKTTIAAIARETYNEMLDKEGRPRVRFHEVMGTTVTNTNAMAVVLAKLQPGDFLFIDECHQIKLQSEEMLGLAMEDGRITVAGGKGEEPITIDIPRFTLIGATTKPAHISKPLQDRFGMEINLDFYSEEELAEITKRAAKREKVISLTPDACMALAIVGRGTPRVVLKRLTQVKAYALTIGTEKVNDELVHEALMVMGVDNLGLDARDKRYLTAVASWNDWSGRRMGLKNIVSATQFDAKEIEEVIEPYLLRAGFLSKTGRGRCCSKRTYAHYWPEMPLPPMLGLS